MRGHGLKSTIEYRAHGASARGPRRGDLAQLFAEGATTTFVPPGRGAAHLADALYELIRVRQEGETHILDLVERHGPHVPSRSTAVILSGTTTLEVARLGPLLDAFAARRVTVAVLAVEADSFLPIDRLASSVEAMSGRRRDLLSFLRDRGVAGTVLASDDDLPATLVRADLLEGRA